MTVSPLTARHRGTLTMGLLASITVLLAGCAPSPAVDAAGGAASAKSTVEHIHGLGVDELTSTLYVATHGGIFAVPAARGDSPPSFASLGAPIADRAQDTMGFTLLDGTMYGSGHPDPLGTEGDPANLGLIISTDSARSWQSVSLRGEVDFHDLAASRGSDGNVVLHGYSAATGSVMVSTDAGETWSTGEPIAARDLTADADGGALFATTQDGLARSDDRGATFQVLPDAPALYLVESLDTGADGLIGVDAAGKVWTNATGDWRTTGTVSGAAEALTYSTTGRLVVADERGISASEDLGASWYPLLLR